jgi:hypothetical protein
LAEVAQWWAAAAFEAPPPVRLFSHGDFSYGDSSHGDFSHGDVELPACRCRVVTGIVVQAHRTVKRAILHVQRRRTRRPDRP